MTPSASRPPSTWRATPSDPSRFFSDEELARARTYQRPLRRVRWLRAGLSVAVLAVFVLRGWASSLVEWTGVTNWVETLGHRRGYVQFRWQRVSRELSDADGPTVELVDFDAVPGALPYFEHNKISEDQWRARIALRQQQIAARMLG